MKNVFYVFMAVVVTLAAIIYQRKTGPTYDKKVEVNINNEIYHFNLTRSHGGEQDCKIELPVPNPAISGKMEYKKFPSKSDWTTVIMTREKESLVAFLPHLPPAGKYEYRITLKNEDREFQLNGNESVFIRFKGDVPGSILIPHIFFMFFAMLLGNLAGILALFKNKRYKLFTTITVIALFIGGMILGPAVQWYAFGEAWAGVPFAWDLTDNKTLVAFIFWVLAFFMNRKKELPVYTVVASIVMLIVYSIPHSMFGSQLDPETGEIIQGWIKILFLV